MKNDFIAILLPHSSAASESNFKLKSELITEFEWNGRGVHRVTNDPVLRAAIAGSDVWVGMTRFAVALMTQQSTS